jgi:hypothetical protein
MYRGPNTRRNRKEQEMKSITILFVLLLSSVTWGQVHYDFQVYSNDSDDGETLVQSPCYVYGFTGPRWSFVKVCYFTGPSVLLAPLPDQICYPGQVCDLTEVHITGTTNAPVGLVGYLIQKEQDKGIFGGGDEGVFEEHNTQATNFVVNTDIKQDVRPIATGGHMGFACKPGTVCYDSYIVDYTCADKTRVLLTSEDGKKHCIKF